MLSGTGIGQAVRVDNLNNEMFHLRLIGLPQEPEFDERGAVILDAEIDEWKRLLVYNQHCRRLDLLELAARRETGFERQ